MNSPISPMKRNPFKAGDTVLHKRFGLGVIVDQWGAIPFTDELGNQILKGGEPMTIDCSGIYDVRFGDQARCRSVHVCGLAVVQKNHNGCDISACVGLRHV